MILPGLISVAFYRRRPTRLQIALGVVFTAGLSGVLGYWQDAGTAAVWTNVLVAILGGLSLYVGILVYLVYRYFPTHPKSAAIAGTTIPPPAP